MNIARRPDVFLTARNEARYPAEFRQLRHQTKNALASILLQVSEALRTAAAPEIAEDVERRIMLTARLSNALFGLTQAPEKFSARLRGLCRCVVDLLADADQHIEIETSVRSPVPADLETPLLRITHELVGNAIKHGFYKRIAGRIDVTVEAGADGITVSVADDGWGFGSRFAPGEGLDLIETIAGPFDGQLTLRRHAESTVATVRLPLA